MYFLPFFLVFSRDFLVALRTDGVYAKKISSIKIHIISRDREKENSLKLNPDDSRTSRF